MSIDFLFKSTIGWALLVFIGYIYNKLKHSYWKRKNVEGPEPVPIFGNFLDAVMVKTSTHEKMRDLYLAWKHKPFVGLYQLTQPIMLINDPALIKRILIKDFGMFSDRGFTTNEDVDPLAANLLMLEAHRWGPIRNRLSPMFTSAKLKLMYRLFNDCADLLKRHIDDELVRNGNPIDAKEVAAKFTTDVIGSCVFGLNLNALTKEDSEFRKIGRKIFAPTLTAKIKRNIREFTPGLFKLFKMRIFDRDVTEFFVNSIAETKAYRERNAIVRHDFIYLMTELQKNPEATDFELTDELFVAQAFIFFIAGFETAATTISFMLYELARRQDIQEKLRDEIETAAKKHEGHLPFEAIAELKYLDKVMQESLRRNPPGPTLPRRCVKNYTIPDTGVEIPANMNVYISVLGLHYDPQYYPNPEVFDPERFSEEAIRQRPSTVYLPFGEGPRNCIGARFAKYQTKIGVIMILRNYRVTISSKIDVPYVIEKKTLLLTCVGGLHLNFTKVS